MVTTKSSKLNKHVCFGLIKFLAAHALLTTEEDGHMHAR
jgi:hypothetical protein